MKSASLVCTIFPDRARYTFAVKSMFWLAVLVSAVAAVWVLARIWRATQERERAAEARAANLLAGLVGTTAPVATANSAAPPVRAAPIDELSLQKLLFDSAQKAGAAGEPALAIQLYARLLARYPSTTLADAVRSAVEAQKKLIKD